MIETTSHKKKTSGYSNSILHAKKDFKHKQAKIRDAAHSELTTKEKIQKAKSRRGESEKEINRLSDSIK